MLNIFDGTLIDFSFDVFSSYIVTDHFITQVQTMNHPPMGIVTLPKDNIQNRKLVTISWISILSF